MTDVILHITESLDGIQQGLGKLMPELVLTAFFLMVVLIDLFPARSVKNLQFMTVFGLLTTGALYVIAIAKPAYFVAPSFFLDLLKNDGIAFYAGMLFCLAGILTVFLSIFSETLQKRAEGHGEYYALLLALTIGLNLLVKSQNLLMLFVSLELVSIASYLLTLSYRNRKEAVEAGLKYLMFGALASGIMVYGMSFLYGFTGSLQFTDVAFANVLAQQHPVMVLVAVAMVVAGLLFKIAAAPFHFWAADVYEGAPTPIVAFFSAAPKIAGIVVLYRFASVFKSEAFFNRFPEIGLFLGGIALVTLVLGNFTALRQLRARRMLAFSSVSHAGFLLVAVLAAG
ncbi:MAG: NADH-quinone oxidoreductase subunit N, partial [Hymenobacteraceae bacterium]|nr:NADH-quinone oxidoreductase subunit N [Hymenobacteraceae bacterium]MDX5398076.1 NADH-quinone oxidoreductase subunit N [Hymenobacteraceae bacterium]MDX5514147.1 NADH-quinone oxidoreductase subunit N [Hymenobacteraceae bacterium]